MIAEAAAMVRKVVAPARSSVVKVVEIFRRGKEAEASEIAGFASDGDDVGESDDDEAESEVLALKQQLKVATQKNSSLEDRFNNLDGALKEDWDSTRTEEASRKKIGGDRLTGRVVFFPGFAREARAASHRRVRTASSALVARAEFFVKSADRVELMGMLGLFGAIISACQIIILEQNELKSIHWSAGAVIPFIGFALAMFLFYSGVPILLKISGSTMLNLSLLTSDMWTVLIRIFAYRQKNCQSESRIPPQVDWMYFIAFGTVAVGLVIYSGGDKEEDQNRAEVADEEAERSKHFDEEAGSGNPNQKTTAGCSKTGDSSSKSEFASTSSTAIKDTESRTLGKDTQGKKI
ncbi:hypothetical protein TEA_018087 [Camellia sinensis var. sinensis]|uniref:Uncharacterized protein n=1 Tax=Camellia sinensis var. sinensis TaxID=542762 RepID=A0A4S4E797_CAMSN|nr:hypothetical protein TEA_018087 [Camellia sinensis var. sinensis]